jgi:antitoxin HicB
MVRYPVVLEPDDNGTVMVTFPDFPEAQTFGDDEADALARSGDALATIVDGYIRARRTLPTPSSITEHSASLSPLMSTKVELYNGMLSMGLSKSDLGRLLSWHQPQVDRLLNLTHSSQVDQLEAAAKALGGSLTMRIDGLPQRPRVFVGQRTHRMSIAAAVTQGKPTTRRIPAKARRKVAKKR